MVRTVDNCQEKTVNYCECTARLQSRGSAAAVSNIRKVIIKNTERLLQIAYSIIELVNRQELRVTSKKLINNYLHESLHVAYAAKAREAVERYVNEDPLPTLEEVRAKHAALGMAALNEVDHLILKLEHEGRRLDEL